MLSRLICALVALGLSQGIPAADLVVNPSKSGAYPTLQAALDAAMPGDRILIEVSLWIVPTVIRKSVTIESASSARVRVQCWSISYSAALTVESLTPGLPLTLRRLNLSVMTFESKSVRCTLATKGVISGEVRIDDCEISFLGDTSGGNRFEGKAADLRLDKLWMRKSTVWAQDTKTDNGCTDIYAWIGSHALVGAANLVVAEDCTFQGGNAAWLQFCNCCFGEIAAAGWGGSAFAVSAQETWLVRCTIRNGNGGSVMPGAWRRTPLLGGPGNSAVSAQGSYQVYLEPGLPGTYTSTPPSPSRGTQSLIGATSAPLLAGGDTRLGGSLDVAVIGAPGMLKGLLFSSALLPSKGVLGSYLVDLQNTFLVVPLTGSTQLSLSIPSDPALAEFMVATQLVQAGGTYGFTDGNPSLVAIRK